MVANHVRPRSRNERDQLLDQLVRREHHVRGAVAPGLLESEGQAPVRQLAQAIVGDRWPREVLHQVLESLAVIGAGGGVGVDVEAGDFRAALAGNGGAGIVAARA